MSTSVVKCSRMKCSEDLSNRVSNIIRKSTDFLPNFKFVSNVFYIFIYSHCYVYPFLYICFHRVNWHSSASLTKFLPCFFSVVKQMPAYNTQRWGMARTLHKLIVLFYLLFVCKCVLNYCHRMSNQFQLKNISTYQHTTLNSKPNYPSTSFHTEF